MVPTLVLLGTLVAYAGAQTQWTVEHNGHGKGGRWRDISDGSFSGGADEIARRARAALDQRQRAKNVILFIGDGNGISTNFATRLYAGQQQGLYGDEYMLPHETMPALAMVKTYNSNAQTPDSAGTATALHAGLKTKSGVLGLDENARKGFCEDVPDNTVMSIAEHAKRLGKKVGIVSTARVTHATPGAVYAHSADRDWEASVPVGCNDQKDIAAQLFDAMIPTDGEPTVDVSLGGGRRSFFPRGVVGPEGDDGDRADGLDLIERFTANGGAYAWNTPTFEALPLDGDEPILGLFESSHMSYEFDRVNGSLSEPSIMEMTAAAVQALEARDVSDTGYFLMVEAGRIDHANHVGNLFRVVTDGVAYQEAIAYALGHTDPTETLIISTADHSHGLEFNGYCGRGSPILGMCYKLDDEGERHLDEAELADDGRPYTVAGYLNGMGSVIAANGTNVLEAGPNGRLARPELSAEQAKASNYEQQALVPLYSETHSATDVAVYGQGPSSQLLFGTIEQSWIFHVMLHAFEAPPTPPLAVEMDTDRLARIPAVREPSGDTSTSMSTISVGVLSTIVGAAIGGYFGHHLGSRREGSKVQALEEMQLL